MGQRSDAALVRKATGVVAQMTKYLWLLVGVASVGRCLSVVFPENGFILSKSVQLCVTLIC